MAFYNISREEMNEFLEPQGFQKMILPGVVELVYGKIVYHGSHRLSMRIYTAINPTGESREKGSDAIRLQMYWLYDGNPIPVGCPQKCLRVPNWRANMKAAIERCVSNDKYAACPVCSSPMAIRHRRTDNQEFWACSVWFNTGCRGIRGR